MTTNADTEPAHSSATPAHRTPASRTYRNARPNPPQAYISGFHAYDASAPLAARFGVVIWDGVDSLDDCLYPVYLTRKGRLIMRQADKQATLPRGVWDALRREAIARMGNK